MIGLTVAKLGESCVGNDTIAAYVARELDDAAKTRVDGHVARCDACRRAVSDEVRGAGPRYHVIADTVARWEDSTPLEEGAFDLIAVGGLMALIAAAAVVLWQLGMG
jgi:NaMN:DMB phosphoribosyltransferase